MQTPQVAQAEPEQIRNLIPTNPKIGIGQHDSFIQDTSMTAIDDQDIITWISQGIHASPLETLDPLSFPGALTQYGSNFAQGHDNLFSSMNLETDKPIGSSDSSSSLYNLSNTRANCDPWMTSSPITPNALSPVDDHRQSPSVLEELATQTDVTETATPSSSNEISSLSTTAEGSRTVLTLQNLDSETRSEVLDLLFRRKIVTTIEIF